MKSFLNSIRYDYLQRTRSYSFLITLCASLAIAYTFVPEPNANYSTIRIADYVGYYNSAWFGYVTAIMTSIFLSLIGFYLINSGIKKDIETRVGQIVAATPISNFKYLFSKVLSNFILLLTIVAVVFIMSIILFILYNDGFSFELFQFIKPYVLITIPAMFFISVLAVVFEVLLGKFSVLQNVGFFFLFSILMVFTPKTEASFSLDVFGSKIVVNEFEETVRDITNSDKITALSIGYVVPDDITETKKFEFNGMNFPMSFIISRFVWMLLGIGIIGIISILFHRFDRKERVSLKKIVSSNNKPSTINDISLSSLPKPQINYNIFPLLKIEFLLLFRKGKKWLWLLNALGMGLLVALPLQTAHQFVLPILWFLQVGRLSELTTKEVIYNVQYFTFTSFKPLSRLLVSQLLSGIVIILFLSTPLLTRYLLEVNLNAMLSILIGGIGIVLFASTLGIVTKGKKLFEVLFFMITYANINGIVFMDYFGSMAHGSWYLPKLILFSLCLGAISFLMRNYQLRR